MAIDNSLYDSLENVYIKIKDYFDTHKLGAQHSQMIIKHEELADLLESFDIEALEEQSKDIDRLHGQLDDIKKVSIKLIEDLDGVLDSMLMTNNVVNGLDKIFLKITKVTV